MTYGVIILQAYIVNIDPLCFVPNERFIYSKLLMKTHNHYDKGTYIHINY